MLLTGGGGVTTIDKEDNRTKRQIRESIPICQHGIQVMSRDEESFELPHIWDSVIPTINSLGGGDQQDLTPLPPGGSSVLMKMADAAFETVNK